MLSTTKVFSFCKVYSIVHTSSRDKYNNRQEKTKMSNSYNYINNNEKLMVRSDIIITSRF